MATPAMFNLFAANVLSIGGILTKISRHMRCFYHQDHEAIGICKSCGKGLCPQCAADLDKGLACRSRCEEDVEALIRLVQRNIQLEPTTTRLVQAGSSARRLASLFFFLIGAVFLFYGWTHEEGPEFLTFLGGIFIVYAIIHAVWSRRLAVPKAHARIKD